MLTMAHKDNPLTELSVLDDSGDQVPLASLWRDRSTMLVFVRHFGCLFCQDQVRELNKIEQPLRELAIDLVVLGNSAPHFIAGFRERSGYQGKLILLVKWSCFVTCARAKLCLGPHVARVDDKLNGLQ